MGAIADDVKGRIAQIKREIDETDSDWDREKLQERLAKLAGGVAVVKVGAATEVELKEKKHRIEDALSATRAAVEEGIVAGGGTALVRSRAAVQSVVDSLEGDEATGATIVLKALAAPLEAIANNAGLEGSVFVKEVEGKKGHIGLNAATGELEDLVKAGVIDPAKVTRSALQNAASIAGLLLTTEALVADKPEKADAGRCRSRGCRHGRRHGWHGWHGRHDVVTPPVRSQGRHAAPAATSFSTMAGPAGPANVLSGVSRLGTRWAGSDGMTLVIGHLATGASSRASHRDRDSGCECYQTWDHWVPTRNLSRRGAARWTARLTTRRPGGVVDRERGSPSGAGRTCLRPRRSPGDDGH